MAVPQWRCKECGKLYTAEKPPAFCERHTSCKVNFALFPEWNRGDITAPLFDLALLIENLDRKGISCLFFKLWTDAAYFCPLITVLPPLKRSPHHLHNDNMELLYVLKGCCVFQIAETMISITTGQPVKIKKGQKHMYLNFWDENAVIFSLFAPSPPQTILFNGRDGEELFNYCEKQLDPDLSNHPELRIINPFSSMTLKPSIIRSRWFEELNEFSITGYEIPPFMHIYSHARGLAEEVIFIETGELILTSEGNIWPCKGYDLFLVRRGSSFVLQNTGERMAHAIVITEKL